MTCHRPSLCCPGGCNIPGRSFQQPSGQGRISASFLSQPWWCAAGQLMPDGSMGGRANRAVLRLPQGRAVQRGSQGCRVPRLEERPLSVHVWGRLSHALSREGVMQLCTAGTSRRQIRHTCHRCRPVTLPGSASLGAAALESEQSQRSITVKTGSPRTISHSSREPQPRPLGCESPPLPWHSIFLGDFGLDF